MATEAKTSVERTEEKDVQFIINLENSMMDARRLLNSVVRDWNNLDALSLAETLNRAHTLITGDLYFRMEALAERRGSKNDFDYDIAILVESAGALIPDDSQYHSKLLSLYFRILSRYQFWMDQLGILLTNIPFNPNFSAELIEAMQQEFVVGSRRELARKRAREIVAGRQVQEVVDAGGPGQPEPS